MEIILQTAKIDNVYWCSIKHLGRYTHRVLLNDEVYCLSRTFEDAVNTAGALRIKHGESVQLERIQLKIIQGGRQ